MDKFLDFLAYFILFGFFLTILAGLIYVFPKVILAIAISFTIVLALAWAKDRIERS